MNSEVPYLRLEHDDPHSSLSIALYLCCFSFSSVLSLYSYFFPLLLSFSISSTISSLFLAFCFDPFISRTFSFFTVLSLSLSFSLYFSHLPQFPFFNRSLFLSIIDFLFLSCYLPRFLFFECTLSSSSDFFFFLTISNDFSFSSVLSLSLSQAFSFSFVVCHNFSFFNTLSLHLRFSLSLALHLQFPLIIFSLPPPIPHVFSLFPSQLLLLGVIFLLWAWLAGMAPNNI